jgi:hypothetical protein
VTIPSKLFSLNTLWTDAGTDPHLVKGAHLRWAQHPYLGLPHAPVEIQKATLDEGWVERCPPEAMIVTEIDHGTALPLPVGLANNQLLWARPPIGSGSCLAIRLRVKGINPSKVVGGFNGPGGFVEVISGVATVSSSEIWLTAAGVEVVKIHGPGRLLSADCFSYDCLSHIKFRLVGYAGPGFENLTSYDPTPLDDPEARAKERVRTGAPILEALNDAIEATLVSPMPNTPDREWNRVKTLVAGGIEKHYLHLLDSSAPPVSITSSEPLVNSSGSTAADLTVPTFALLMAAIRDPSVARWAGMSWVDRELPGQPTVYRVRASFDPARFDETHEKADEFRALVNANADSGDGLLIKNPRLVLTAYSLVLPGAISTVPTVSFQGPPLHQRWVGGTAPALRRLVHTNFIPPVNATGYAWYRSMGGVLTALNTLRTGTGYRALASAVRNQSGGLVHHLSDHQAPAAQARYGVAAMDAFGRWSAFAEVLSPAGELSRPPKPVPEAEYLRANTEPVDNSLRAGHVRVTIPIPDTLPPGVMPIDIVSIQVSASDGTLIDETTVVVGTSATEITVTLAGPPLARGVRETVMVTAQFTASGVNSEEGNTQVLAVDARNPTPLTISPDLNWTTLADAADSSQFQLNWNSSDQHQGYRVYVATTQTLQVYLSGLGPTGLDAQRAIDNPMLDKQALVEALSAHLATLPRSAFELVTSTLIKSVGGQGSYLLKVPGRSRLLYLARVTAVGHNNLEEPWSETPAAFWVAVPPTVKLQPPELDASTGEDLTPTVELKATLRHGQPANAWRLFRTTKANLANPGQMSEVITLPVAITAPEDGGTEDLRAPLAVLTHLDQGSTVVTPDAHLRPWRTYIYRAQIQALSEPGAPEGVWSELSAPASTVYVPREDPPAAMLTATTSGSIVNLSWDCELPQKRTDLGDFRFRVFYINVNATIPIDVGSQSALEDMAIQHMPDKPLPGRRYFVETIDPTGRRTLSNPVLEGGTV